MLTLSSHNVHTIGLTGSRRELVMFCPKCGTQQSSQARACVKCGAPLPATGNLDPRMPQPQPRFEIHTQKEEPQTKARFEIKSPPRPVTPPGWTDPPQPNEQPQPPVNVSYQPGQYLDGFTTRGQEIRSTYEAPGPQVNQAASSRAISALVFGILSFTICPFIAAIVAMVQGRKELDAIKAGEAPTAGKGLAQAGYYLGMVNLGIYGLYFAFLFLLFLIAD